MTIDNGEGKITSNDASIEHSIFDPDATNSMSPAIFTPPVDSPSLFPDLQHSILHPLAEKSLKLHEAVSDNKDNNDTGQGGTFLIYITHC